MRKMSLQVVLAVISGLNIAGPLILDVQQIFPSWQWQYHILTGFFVFCVVMIWIILSFSVPLHQIQNSKPNIVWFKNSCTALYRRDDNGKPKMDEYLYHALQIWFKNQPKEATDDSVAKKVTALVTVYDKENKVILPTAPGVFIITESLYYAANIGWEEVVDEWDPNDEPRKLQIAIKRSEDQSAYMYAKANIQTEIKEGSYYIEVELKGTRITSLQPFWFELNNSGSGYELTLSTPIMKPNLCKEGFQIE